jgi:hypothetical protein
MTLDEAVIVFKPKEGKEKTLNYEEKLKFVEDYINTEMTRQAVMVGIPLSTDEGDYTLTNPERPKYN